MKTNSTFLLLFISIILRAQPGTYDPTFGIAGIDTTSGVSANAMALQKDGKIVVGGHFNYGTLYNELKSDFALARYNTDGSQQDTLPTTILITQIFVW